MTKTESIAGKLIVGTGARVTRPRVAVLAELLAANRALTHREVAERLAHTAAIDRVTVYRVLDWLNEQGLAHKVAGEGRSWHFNAAGHVQDEPHAHFECAACGHVLCLDTPPPRAAIRLPRGYELERIELLAKGWCPDCRRKRTPPARARTSS